MTSLYRSTISDTIYLGLAGGTPRGRKVAGFERMGTVPVT
jgi:hypothetical protein